MTGWEVEHVRDPLDHADAHAEFDEWIDTLTADGFFDDDAPDEEAPEWFRNYAGVAARPRYPDGP